MEKPRGSLVIYAALVERRGTGWALSEVPQPMLAGRVALVMLGCAGPGWHLGWRWPGEEPTALQRCWGFLQWEELSLCFRAQLMPELSFIGLAGQIGFSP